MTSIVCVVTSDRAYDITSLPYPKAGGWGWRDTYSLEPGLENAVHTEDIWCPCSESASLERHPTRLHCALA